MGQDFRLSLDHTIRFVHDLDRARNLTDISKNILRHLASIGAESVIATPMPKVGASCRQQLSSVLFQEIPSEWASTYARRNYAFKDPIIHRMMSLATPFFWDEIEGERYRDPEGDKIMGEAKEFGLNQGFSTSLVTLEGQTVGFSVAGRHFTGSSDMRGVLTLIASYAIGRAIALQQGSFHENREIRLSAREREALQWAAEGKNDWEIGEVMNISEHGAEKHLRSVRAKLGVINRTQAVAEAIRRGLIA
ncbi:MAG TPA: autoinducer binding domain-containing protein [Methylocella sp.]|nr:autoinducer binding domain-containing protein [Methylocella sp.]